MRAPLISLAVSMASVAALARAQGPAQVQRLVDSIEAPVAYLCLEAMPAAVGADARQVGAVQRLLADPSLDAFFRPQPGADATGSTKALALVRGVLARSSGELELALTGIVPNGGQPLLVLRARLQSREADSLQMVLDAQAHELATPARRLGGNTVYHLNSTAKATAPGQDVELALVGADLVVGNDSTAMREVLEPRPAATATANKSKVLSADARFVAMRQRLPISPGALWLYGDWQRLGQRIEGSLGGLPGALMGSSGLGSARAVMASISAEKSAEKSDFTATLLLDFNAPVPPPARAPRPERPERPDFDGDGGIDGWFAAVEPVPARSLLGELPAGGLGGLVLSVDLSSVANRSHEGWHLLHDLDRAFEDLGQNFQRNVLSRLGKRGTVQLLVDKGPQGAELGAIYTIRTKNKKAAGDLFDDLRRACERAGLAMPLTKEVKDSGRERRTVDLLELRHGAPREGARGITMYLAAHEDSLLLSADSDTLVAAVDELRHPGKPRPRRELSAGAISAIGGENVAGLFDVDLQPLFEQLAAVVVGAGGGALDLSALPKRHVGYLDLQKQANGTVVRMRLLSSR